jgi:AcrR family transcriptional regulator
MSRNKELNEKIKEVRRETILTAALELFAFKGLAATRISDISSRAGISQGLIYHYYQSKEEIFTALILTAMEKMNEAALILEKLPVSAKDKLIHAVEELLKGFKTHVNTASYYFLITQTILSESFPVEAKEIIRTRTDVKKKVISRILKQGQAEGTVKNHDVQEMTNAFFSSINGLALHKAIYGPDFRFPDKDILLGMFLKEC